MPELPEVETVLKGLKEVLIDRKIKNVQVLNEKSFFGFNAANKNRIIDQKIILLKRRGKIIIIILENKNYLLIHLKMTGQIIYRKGNYRFGAGHPNQSFINKMPDKTTRIIFTFDDRSKVFFNDQRKFGWIKLFNQKEYDNFSFLQRMGPEPLDPKFTYIDLKNRLFKKSNSILKAVLLDQSVLAGLGNIYVDESLWLAKLNPTLKVKELTDIQIKKLYKAIKSNLLLSIKEGGASDRNYININGQKGSFIKFAKVYKKENSPCARCKTTLIRIKVAGRGTRYCPKCQKIN